MEEQIRILEERVNMLEAIVLHDPRRILLGDIVSEYIREHYPYNSGCYTDLYFRVLESMKEQIKTMLMGEDH